MSVGPSRRCSLCGIEWAAGFFEGEGSVSWAGRKRNYAQLEIVQKNREPLDWFLEIVGVGRIYGPYQYGNGNPCYKFATHGERALGVIRSLYPLLSSRRQEQAVALFGLEVVDDGCRP